MAVITLADAKAHLGITTTNHDAELPAFIATAEAIIVNEVGPISPVLVQSRVVGGSQSLILPHSFVQSVTSISDPYGYATAPADTYVTTSGVVTRNDGGYFGARHYVVSYIAGHSPIPTALTHAVKEQLRHLWRTQRGTGRRSGQGNPEADAMMMPAPGSLPLSVEQLIAPYRLNGFA